MSVYEGELSLVGERLHGLQRAVAAATDRLPADAVAPGAEVVARAAERLRLSGDHTIVALAGATGSGKSSLFNRLTELELAGVGLKRPTTTWSLACSWGPEGAEGLLEWMGIPPRHQVSRRGMLDWRGEGSALDGLILLDLPDHDSTEVQHRVEMDRLITYADLLIWVLDPQKYADAAIHDQYIRPMAPFADVTLVVLNQIDRVPDGERARAVADVQRLVTQAGMPDVPVLAVSAATGEGLDVLRAELARRVQAKRAARDRLSAEIAQAATALAAVGGTSVVPGITEADIAALDQGLIDAVGVREVARAIATATRRRGARSTAWPALRWLIRRPGKQAAALATEPGSVLRAHTENVARTFADKSAVGLEGAWRDRIRGAIAPDLVPRLASAIRSTRLGADSVAWWWPLANVVQWLLFLASLGGLGWFGAARGSDRFDWGVPPPPDVDGYLLPLWIAAGAFVAGIALAIVARFATWARARRVARQASTRLRLVIDRVARTGVADPVAAELAAYGEYREGLAVALR